MMTIDGLVSSVSNSLWILAAAFSSLAAGSLVRLVALRRADGPTRAERLASLRTWWLLAIALAAAVLCGRWGIAALVATASVLAMYEYVNLLDLGLADRRCIWIVYLAIPVHYALIALGWQTEAVLFGPVALLVVLAALRVLGGEPAGYVRATAGLFWGMMILVYGLSHAAMLVGAPAGADGAMGSAGWFLYLVLLVETNDIAQALVGRRFAAGRVHRITPRVSPKKTWEGFLGGLLVTIPLAVALAPPLTPLAELPVAVAGVRYHIPFFWPAAAGILIAVSGFLGDINMSAVKRDAGVKDSSRLLPGMGGVIDRVDSLTFAAPAFFYFVQWLT